MTTSVDTGETRAGLPDPGAARTLDDLIERLRLLKIWAGDPSYESIKDRINAAWTGSGRPASELERKNTVADCFRTGRRRINTDLVIAVVEVLHPDATHLVTGEPDVARGHWERALERYAELGVPEADEVRAHLASLGDG